MVGNLGSAALKVGKLIAAGFSVKKVIDFGKAAFDSYQQYEQLWGGVQKLYGNAGMDLETYAKSVNKSTDAVKQDYERNERAQALMLENANKAWKTAGMDANSYMETATSFSASLINSLGGDTEEAARLTDVAMGAMSDNINTFGTDAQSVQNAFQGFAKQNYAMLDNLKLGYGGTKTEMERLIKDANAWAKENGKAADLSVDKFSDVVTAIQYIQEAQGIAGTTEREALSTIEGSMNATKAAWSNFVAEFGKGGGDMKQRFSDLTSAASAAAKNITREVGVVASTMVTTVSDAVGTAIDDLITNGPEKFGEFLGTIEEKLGAVADDISQNGFNLGIADAILGDGEDEGAASKIGTFIENIKAKFEEHWPAIRELGTSILTQIGQGIFEEAQRLGPWVGEQLQGVFNTAVSWLENNWGDVVSTQFETGLNFADIFWQMAPQAVDAVAGLLQQVQQFIVEHGPEFAAQIPSIISNVASSIAEHVPSILSGVGTTIGSVFGYLEENRWQMVNAAIEFFSGLLDGSSEEGAELQAWLKDFFPDGAMKLVGDVGTLLVQSGEAFINGFADGIEDAAPNVMGAIEEAFGPVLGFFTDLGLFLLDPIAFITDKFLGLADSTSVTMETMQGSFAGLSKTSDRELGGVRSDINKLNNTKLKDQSVVYTASGNVIDGKGKTQTDSFYDSYSRLSNKTTTYTANGNVIDGTAKTKTDDLRAAIDRLKGKEITVTTNYRNTGSGPTNVGMAWGGIRRYHARGGLNIASRFGEGVPLDYVGEKGPEAIVPLKSPYGTDFARIMGKEAAKYVGGHGDVNIYLDYNAGEDATALVNDIAGELRTLGLVE
jgi:hypothetical protein